jgi:hypothetical protein
MSIKFTIPNVPTAVDYTATSVSNNGATIPVINKPTLATVATSGAYTDLTSQPTIPSKLSQLTNDALAVTGTSTFNGMTTVANGLVVSGQAAATAQNFPTAAMTANASPEGFVATASSVNTQTNVNQIYYAFDKAGTTRWASSGAAANLYGGGTTGANTYTGTTTTTVSGTAVAGEWIQLQTPVPYRLSSYVMTDGNARQKQWTLAGSQDGITWYTIDSQNLQTVLTTPVTYSSFTQPGVYSYYRLIVQVVTASAVTDLTDLIFNGFPYSGGSLTVAGNATLTGGVTSTKGVLVTAPVTAAQTFPSAPLTSNTGPNGFTVSASSLNAQANYNQAYYAFDGSTATNWASSGGYSGTVFNGTTTTTVSGTSIGGEWLQLQTPVPYRLATYTLNSNQYKQWTLAGSVDGTTWSFIDSQSLSTGLAAPITITPASVGVYSYFRYICQAAIGNSVAQVTELSFSGYANATEPGLTVTGNLTSTNLTAGELTKTNALAATWYQGGTATSLAAGAVTYPGPWVLQSFSKVPSGLTLLNGSNNLVIPYNGVYFMSWTARFNTYSSEIAISFNPSSGTYGSGTRRLGAADFQSGALNPISSYVGYFTAGDVIAPTVYTATTNTVGANNGDTYLSLVLIARTP